MLWLHSWVTGRRGYNGSTRSPPTRPAHHGNRVHAGRSCRIMDAMSANPHDALPIRLNVDDSDSPSDVVDALFLGRFATGEQPYSHAATLRSSVTSPRLRCGG